MGSLFHEISSIIIILFQVTSVLSQLNSQDSNILDIFYNQTGIILGDKVGHDTLINIASHRGNYDAGFVCSIHDMTYFTEDKHIIRIEPHITEQIGEEGVVHHMDLFACQDSPIEEYQALSPMQQNTWCMSDSFLKSSCHQMMWAYDKGADAFDFPHDVGMLLGPSSGIDSIVIQIHYLLPENYEPDGIGFKDVSGFRLFMEPAHRPYDVGMFGFLEADMIIPSGKESFEFRAHLNSEKLVSLISVDMQAHGKVYPIAVHLHGHEHLIGARLEHYRGNELIGTYGDITPYHGYGHDQTFLTLGSPEDHDIEPLLESDSLTFVCTYNSSMLTFNMHYGVSHGDEMCGPLVLYYPKVRGKDAMTENIAMVVKGESRVYEDIIRGIEGEE
jgi:hypothetical protein